MISEQMPLNFKLLVIFNINFRFSISQILNFSDLIFRIHNYRHRSVVD